MSNLANRQAGDKFPMPSKVKTLLVVISIGLVAGGFWLWNNRSHNSDYGLISIAKIIAKTHNPDVKKESPDSQPKNITILFGGDLGLDRYIRQVGEKKGYDFMFEKLDPLLQGNDLNVVNLEGPITDKPSISLTSAFATKENYVFTFDPETAGILKKHNISLVNLGNNHILNFKEDGVRQTEKYLQDAGVNYIGSPIDDSASKFQVLAFSNFKIAFVNYNQFAYQGKEKALEDILNAKLKSDLVILYAHWGKEYELQPLESVKDLAHEFVDAGADLIIGSHPHVVQGKEVYKGKTIYYSLGNFIFDQYFQKETTEGLAVKATINPETIGITFQEIPLKLQNNGQTSHRNGLN